MKILNINSELLSTLNTNDLISLTSLHEEI